MKIYPCIIFLGDLVFGRMAETLQQIGGLFCSALNVKHFLLVVLFVLVATFTALGQAKSHQLRKDVLKSIQQQKEKENNEKGLPPFRPLAPIVNPLANRNATLVYLENSETLSFDKDKHPDMQILKGNVRFRHDNALMYCDSAYFYENANSLDAFGHVRIVQGDTLFVYGDLLYYDGNQKLARLRHHVRMINRKTTLTTDSLNYDRLQNLAYYYTGGKIRDDVNTLSSVWGQYSPSVNEALFKNKVHLVNKDFILDADTLKYNTKSNVADLVGPTHIIYKKETDIFSDNGWYNTANEKMMLLDRSMVKHKGGKILIGDTIFYDKRKKFGECFSRVEMKDTVQKASLFGNYIYYNEKDTAGMATDSALLVDWSSKDTMYVHADSLFTYKDSAYNMAKGYYHVRLYRNDVQGICDSLLYSSRDSVIHMYREPVLWAEDSQLSGDSIRILTKNKKVDRVMIQNAAMAVQKLDTLHFNQLSGKEIIAYVDSGQLRRVYVNGNAETIYYPRDDKDSTLVGLNKTQSSYVNMYLKNKKVQKVVLTSATNGIMYPVNELSGGDIYLKNYFWLPEERPRNKTDVFTVYPAKPRVKIGTSTLPPPSVDNGGSSSTSNNQGNSNEGNRNFTPNSSGGNTNNNNNYPANSVNRSNSLNRNKTINSAQ